MTAPRVLAQIDEDWYAWTFDHCIVCGEPAVFHGYVRLFEPALGLLLRGANRYRTTWVRAGWCEDEGCVADRMDTTYLPRERADEIAANLAAAVHRAEREAVPPNQGEQ